MNSANHVAATSHVTLRIKTKPELFKFRGKHLWFAATFVDFESLEDDSFVLIDRRRQKRMGRIFLEHPGGARLYSCANCDTVLTNRSELISMVSLPTVNMVLSQCVMINSRRNGRNRGFLQCFFIFFWVIPHVHDVFSDQNLVDCRKRTNISRFLMTVSVSKGRLLRICIYHSKLLKLNFFVDICDRTGCVLY